jgi:hypothetical protein
MIISIHDLDLKIVPFGRRLSHMMVIEDNLEADLRAAGRGRKEARVRSLQNI